MSYCFDLFCLFRFVVRSCLGLWAVCCHRLIIRSRISLCFRVGWRGCPVCFWLVFRLFIIRNRILLKQYVHQSPHPDP